MKKKMTMKQKFLHFICYPIFVFLAMYLLFSFLAYLFKSEPLISSERAFTTSAVAIGVSIAYWVGLIYPPKSPSNHKKNNRSLKEYFKQYVVEGSLFNRMMFIIYLLCIISVIVVALLSITGRL